MEGSLSIQYYTNYIRQGTDNHVSADQFKVGVNYADNFTLLASWPVCEEVAVGQVNQITFYTVQHGLRVIRPPAGGKPASASFWSLPAPACR